MSHKISARLLELIDALPIKNGMRILEIGCGTGVAAKELVRRFDSCYVLGVDRSLKAIEQARKNASAELSAGKISFIHASIEDFTLPEKKKWFDLAFAIRVGALDGRHPELEKRSIDNIRKTLKPKAKLYIDRGGLVKEVYW